MKKGKKGTGKNGFRGIRSPTWLALIAAAAITSQAMPVLAGEETSPVITAGGGAVRPSASASGSGHGDGPGVSRWVQDEAGWYYELSYGNYVCGRWEKIDGRWYYFDENGLMRQDDWVTSDDKQYRVGEDGAMLEGPGTINIDGTDYELDEDGAATAISAKNPVLPKTQEDLQAEATAAGILTSITNDRMSKSDKARAIYSYVRGNMRYSNSNIFPSNYTEAAAALYGFRRHNGNCYVYYSMSHYLLEMADMPNLRVIRASDGHHFWNLVNVDGTWYHFDTTPYRVGGTWCLVTTGTLRGTWGIHNYDVGAYPATP